jgi:hypothetical protein
MHDGAEALETGHALRELLEQTQRLTQRQIFSEFLSFFYKKSRILSYRIQY